MKRVRAERFYEEKLKQRCLRKWVKVGMKTLNDEVRVSFVFKGVAPFHLETGERRPPAQPQSQARDVQHVEAELGRTGKAEAAAKVQDGERSLQKVANIILLLINIFDYLIN